MSFGATACLGCGWMPDLLSDFRAAVARHPERVAIVDGRGTETTFADLKVRADGLARAWASRGVGAGDRVLLAMRLDADLYAALAALWSLGATVVLPEPAMGLSGLRHAARVTAARAFCSSGAYGLLKYALPELWPCRHLRPKGSQEPPPGPSPACGGHRPDLLHLWHQRRAQGDPAQPRVSVCAAPRRRAASAQRRSPSVTSSPSPSSS
jgi:acyl-CoA synthetase (AMP-forming)/AMP-acid ligase II